MHLASLSAAYSTRVDATSGVQYEVTAKVPAYSTDPAQAYAIDQRMKELGRLSATIRSFPKIAKAQNLPPGMGDAGAAKQSGVKCFGEIAESETQCIA